MKVILLKDIPKIGKKFEIKDLSEGHVLNLLMPRGLVTPATPKAVLRIALEKEKVEGEKKIQDDLLVKSLDTLKNSTVTIVSKSNEKGHLFAGINKEMLISEIFKQTHLNLSPDSIILEKPLKEVGEHKVTIQALGKKADMTVVIKGE